MTPTSPKFKSLPASHSYTPTTSPKTAPSAGQNLIPVEEKFQAADSSYNPFGDEVSPTNIAPIPFDKIIAMGTESDSNPFPGKFLTCNFITSILFDVIR